MTQILHLSTFKTLLLFLSLFEMFQLAADSTSTTGTLRFNTSLERRGEMTLNSTGLSLGQGIIPSTNLHVAGNALMTGSLSLGSSTMSSANLRVQGSWDLISKIISSNTVLGDHSLVLVDSTSGNITLELPYAGNVNGRSILVKNISNHYVRVISPGNTMDHYTILELPPLNLKLTSAVEFFSGASRWNILRTVGTTPTEMASSNLVAHWAFEDSSGNIASDESGHNRTCNFHSLSFPTDQTTGPLKKSLVFTGNPDHGIVSSTSALRPSQLTISTWVNPSSTTTTMSMFSMDYSGDVAWVSPWTAYQFNILPSGNVRAGLCVGGSLATIQSSAGEAQANTWTHCAFTYDGNKLTLYVNGILNGENVIGGPLDYGSSQELSVGTRSNYTTGNWFLGALDDARIYDRSFSSEEINIIYQTGKP